MPTFLKLTEVYLNLDEIRAARFEGESVVIYPVHGDGYERYTGDDAARLVDVLHHYRFTHAGELPGKGELLSLCKEMAEHLEIVQSHYGNDGADSLIKRAKETIDRHEGTKHL